MSESPFLDMFTSGPNGLADTETLRAYAQGQGYHHRVAIERLCDEVDRLRVEADSWRESSGLYRAAAFKAANEADRLTETLDRVRALADEWEHGALRWENPLPVPPQVAQVREIIRDPS